MSALKLDGTTINKITTMAARNRATTTEFEFRFGRTVRGKFVPGVARGEFFHVLDTLSRTGAAVPVTTHSVVTLYTGNVRSVADASGNTDVMRKSRIAPPVDIVFGRFSLAAEYALPNVPSSVVAQGERVRNRVSFKHRAYTIDLTHIETSDTYEIEIEYVVNTPPDIKVLMAPVKMVRDLLLAAADAPATGRVVTDRVVAPVSKNAVRTDKPVTRRVVEAFERLFGRRGIRFNNAVNMKRHHFRDLSEYVITPKWDGTRMMLYVNGGETHMFNMTTAFVGPFTAPAVLDGTVFDGEFFENGKYIVYDILFLKRSDMRKLPRIERTLILEETVIDNGLDFDLAEVGYGASLHECFVNYTTKYPDHVLDGVVFAPRTSEYYNKSTLKYKPIELLTIDFLIRPRPDQRYRAYDVYVQGDRRVPVLFAPYPEIQKLTDSERAIIGTGNRIVECRWSGDTFVPLRVRRDKSAPNYTKIAQDIWEDINDPITEREMGLVVEKISATFRRPAPFEGIDMTVGSESFIASSVGSSFSLQRSVLYALDRRFQLARASEMAARVANVPSSIAKISEWASKNVVVFDMYSGRVIYAATGFAESIALAYIVGPVYMAVGRLVQTDTYCRRVERVLDMTACIVEKHYDTGAVVDRDSSVIANIRKFNNWVKAVLISENVRRNDAVLDIGSGRGGDLSKWCIAQIRLLVSVDVSEASLEVAKKRLRNMKWCSMRAMWIHDNPYTNIIDLPDPVDVVSAQFTLHYAFDSVRHAETAVRNIAHNLAAGGRFIATIPNASRITELAHRHGGTFGNEFYSIRVDDMTTFGADTGSMYTFTLTGAVAECPEYLVNIPYLESLFACHGMRLEHFNTFSDFGDKHARKHASTARNMGVARLSDAEKDACDLYAVVVFRKSGRA